MMKKKLLIQLCLLICTYSFGQEGKVIDAIREKFQKWQPVVKDELKTSTKFYHYVWGEHYRNDE